MNKMHAHKHKANRLRHRRRLLAVMLVASLLLSACSPMDILPESITSRLEGLFGRSGGDGTERPGVAVIDPTTHYTCDDVSLGADSARPTNVVGLGVIPTDFGPVPALRVTDPDTGDSIVAPVRGDAGRTGADFVVPIHPNGSPDGGPVTLALFDGDGEECGAMDFVIEPLPAAPGAFKDFVDTVERAHEAVGGLFPEPAGDEPSPMLSPLDLAEDRIRGDDNPNSLRKLVEGTAEMEITPEAERLMDGLIDESGIIDAWEQWAAELERTPDVPPAWQIEDPPHPPLDFNWPEGPPGGDWDPVCDNFWHSPNAAVLSALMRGQSVGAKVQDVAGPFMNATSNLATVVSLGSMLFTGGAPNPVTGVSAVIGTGISVADSLTEMVDKILPGELVELTFQYDEPLYLEDDEDLSGYWGDVMLTASSEGMSLDSIVFNTIVSKAGGKLAKGFLGKHVELEVIERAIAYQGELIGGSLSQGVINAFSDEYGLLYVPGCDFGPVDITDEAYHYAEFEPADGPAVITEHQAFEIVDVGDADLVITVIPEKFGGHSLEQRGPVMVKPIEVTINPERVNGDPGYSATFLVTIENANNAGAAFTLRPTAAHRMETKFIEPNQHEVRVFTSEDSRDFPSTLIAESISGTGLRAYPDAPVRQALALLTSGGGVQVTPGVACVEYGATQQFTADVTGYENKNVVWETTGGSISGSGVFTAPDRDGEYVVRAVSAADSNAFGEARVRVAEQCVCWAALELPRHGLYATTTDVIMGFGPSMNDRGDELHFMHLDFTEARTDLNGIVEMEFFDALWGREESARRAGVEEDSWEFLNMLHSLAGGGRYEREGSGPGWTFFYDIQYDASDGILEFFEIPMDAYEGQSFTKKKVFFSPEGPRLFEGPRVGDTGPARLEITHEAGGPPLWNQNILALGRGLDQLSTADTSRRTTRPVAVIERSLFSSPLSGRDYDWHEFKVVDREVTEHQIQYDLPIVFNVEEFTDEGDGVYWLKGTISGEVAVGDSDHRWIRGPIRGEFQGRFGSPAPSMFGDGSMDLFDFERERSCIFP